MNVKQIDRKIEETETQLAELKDMRASYLKHFSANGDTPSTTRTVTRYKKGRRQKPVGIYDGLSLADAVYQCLRKEGKPLSAHIVANMVLDAKQDGTKRYKSQYYACWNSMYRQSNRIKKHADGKWSAIREMTIS